MRWTFALAISLLFSSFSFQASALDFDKEIRRQEKQVRVTWVSGSERNKRRQKAAKSAKRPLHRGHYTVTLVEKNH